MAMMTTTTTTTTKMASRRSNLVACARPGRRGLGSGSQALGASTSSKTGRPWHHHHHQKNQRRCVKVQARADPKSEAESSNPKSEEKSEEKRDRTVASTLDDLGIGLGPIGLTVGESAQTREYDQLRPLDVGEINNDDKGYLDIDSIHSMTTEEWLQRHEKNGTVDLWLEDEYNAASRVPGGRAYGVGTGEGASSFSDTKHHVTIVDPLSGEKIEVDCPEDRYILYEAEDAGLDVPWSCRMGCCTACAVKVKSGDLRQGQALGVSKELKREGYALMCVSYPESDVELELVEEDEIYDEQFGKWFEKYGMDKALCERDDFALELADCDE